MKTAVIYQSKYGSTKTYANWLASDLGANLLYAGQIKPEILTQYDTIVYGGGIYAGSIDGIGLITKNFDLIKEKNLYLFTVGVSDVTDPENLNKIGTDLKRVLTPEMQEKIHLYHLRGGLRYSQLNFLHRMMMRMLIKMLRKKPENELKEEDKVMLSAFEQDIDFVDRSKLAALIADVKKGGLND